MNNINNTGSAVWTTGSAVIKNPYYLSISESGLGTAIFIGSNAVIHYGECK